MTLVPAKPERFDCLLANDKIISLRWGRAFARLGELVCTSSTDCLTARRERRRFVCAWRNAGRERRRRGGGRMREE